MLPLRNDTAISTSSGSSCSSSAAIRRIFSRRFVVAATPAEVTMAAAVFTVEDLTAVDSGVEAVDSAAVDDADRVANLELDERRKRCKAL